MCATRNNLTTSVLAVVAMGAFVVAGVMRVLADPAHATPLYQDALMQGFMLGLMGLALLVGVLRIAVSLGRRGDAGRHA